MNLSISANLKLALFASIFTITACGGGGSGGGSGSGNVSVPTRISWVAPTTNNDDTPLTALAKYRFYYGPNASSLKLVSALDLEDPNATSLTFDDLTSEDLDALKDLVKDNNTHWFAMAAVDDEGNESVLSEAVQYRP